MKFLEKLFKKKLNKKGLSLSVKFETFVYDSIPNGITYYRVLIIDNKTGFTVSDSYFYESDFDDKTDLVFSMSRYVIDETYKQLSSMGLLDKYEL